MCLGILNTHMTFQYICKLRYTGLANGRCESGAFLISEGLFLAKRTEDDGGDGSEEEPLGFEMSMRATHKLKDTINVLLSRTGISALIELYGTPSKKEGQEEPCQSEAQGKISPVQTRAPSHSK